jgi:hypothetical protein
MLSSRSFLITSNSLTERPVLEVGLFLSRFQLYFYDRRDGREGVYLLLSVKILRRTQGIPVGASSEFLPLI